MSFRKSKITNQVRNNLVMYLDDLFLREGYFQNITATEDDFLGNDLSKLVFIQNPDTYSAGEVWQAPKSNWVHENATMPSGADSPIVPSGVFIGGTYYASNHASYGHVFNYLDGRVIFTSGTAPAANTTVQCSYSYKECRVRIADERTRHALNNDYFENDGLFDSVFPSGTVSVPAAYVWCGGHTFKPYALGGGVIGYVNVEIHFVSNSDFSYILDDLADKVSYGQYSGFNLIDIDDMPELLNWRGSKSANYREYADMTLDSSLHWNKAYWQQADKVRLPTERENWHHIRIDGLLEVRGVVR